MSLYTVQVAPPDLSRAAGDLTRLQLALSREWGITVEDVDGHVLRTF